MGIKRDEEGWKDHPFMKWRKGRIGTTVEYKPEALRGYLKRVEEFKRKEAGIKQEQTTKLLLNPSWADGRENGE